MIKNAVILAVVSTMMLSSCVVVRQGEVAMKRRAGKLVGEPITETTRLYNPFISMYLKVPVRNVNYDVKLDIPSKEGLTIGCEISILYRIEQRKVPALLRDVGIDFEQNLISPIFRSALADVSARFMAKDMHTGMRSIIEDEVKQRMLDILGDRGVIIDAVLMKRIILPPTLTRAIEEKLSAEQDAQRMQFVLEREQLEADRKRVEAEGVRDAQKILSQGLTPEVLRYEQIEAFKMLSRSNNAKVIITPDAAQPIILDVD
jgi:regulator of protease activity HflC (stomatin/prohibitin superfamily)